MKLRVRALSQPFVPKKESGLPVCTEVSGRTRNHSFLLFPEHPLQTRSEHRSEGTDMANKKQNSFY